MRESIIANMLDISINGRLATANFEFGLHYDFIHTLPSNYIKKKKSNDQLIQLCSKNEFIFKNNFHIFKFSTMFVRKDKIRNLKKKKEKKRKYVDQRFPRKRLFCVKSEGRKKKHSKFQKSNLS